MRRSSLTIQKKSSRVPFFSKHSLYPRSKPVSNARQVLKHWYKSVSVAHKRTFFFVLEQLILKHGAYRGHPSIETFRDGMISFLPDKVRLLFHGLPETAVPDQVKFTTASDTVLYCHNLKHSLRVD
jgi:hypothetical protein